MSGSHEILLGREGGIATIIINRPQALNALTLDNYRRFTPAVRDWAADPTVHVVIVRGVGERAFCAGGDVRAVYEAGRGISGDPDLRAVFFREEYELIRDIHRFPKPYLAIMDGITMGGGAGISVNGAYRIATESTLFAMPETAIGLFPDVGATRFLNRCPGQIGRYLGLTGVRLRAADTIYCGFATHLVPHERVVELVAALGRIDWEASAERRQIDAVLSRFAVEPGAAPLATARPGIDRCFAGATVEEMLQTLDAEVAAGGDCADWAGATRATLLTKSPTSLKITLRQLQLGRGYDLETALALEYRLTQHMMGAHDFYEGVRAMLIDKDQKPHWRPATLAEVSDDIVDAYFTSIGDRELRFAQAR